MKRLVLPLSALFTLLLLSIVCGCGSGTNGTNGTNPNPSIVSLSVWPSTVTLSEGQTQQFAATVNGTAQTAVSWSVTGCTGNACGVITRAGLYTAPSYIPAAETVGIVATLQSDPTKTATAKVNHVPRGGTVGEAQGVYFGTYGGFAMYSIVMPDDMYYAVYGAPPADGSPFVARSMMTGAGKSDNGTFTANLTNFLYAAAVPVSLTATYVPGVSMTGSIIVNANGYITTFDTTAPPYSSFDYNAPANIAQITGTWSGSSTITINSDGTFTGSTGNCSFSGTMTPDASNKNFFNVAITQGGACYPPNETGSGVAFDILLPDGITRQLLGCGRMGNWFFVITARR